MQPLTKEKPEIRTWIPLSREENQMSLAFDRLVKQDETTKHDLFKEALELLFVKHKLDLGGNPQRQLLSFEAPLIVVRCGCGKVAVKRGLHLASGVERDFCVRCFGELPARHDPKVWRFP